jgi:CHAD domain-containing protein
MAPARPIPDLSCDDSFRNAAGKTIWTRFEEMMSFREPALDGRDPEGVHDMRVGSRRLRAAVELYRDVFPQRRLRPMLIEVKRIADVLGGVRDLDVMLENLRSDMKGRPLAQKMALRALISDMEEQRAEARQALKALVHELSEDDFGRRFLSFVARETA